MKHSTEVMTSSQLHDWCTPQSFVDGLPFDFTLDVCATLESAKCADYISPKMDALNPDRRWPGVCWMNPPYDRVQAFVEKAVREAELGSTIVALIAARTETHWFHNVWKHASLICFVGRRIKFTKPETATDGKTAGAPYPNVVAVFGTLELPSAEIPDTVRGADHGYYRAAIGPEWYAQELSKIGTVVSAGHGAIRLHGEKG